MPNQHKIIGMGLVTSFALPGQGLGAYFGGLSNIDPCLSPRMLT